jgi:hypothetical protein
MINMPIVIVKRREGKTLQIVCPHCHRHHCHGSGGNSGPYVGHRLAHCADAHLPPPLRKYRHSLGYHLIDLTEFDMTEQNLTEMFDEMDVIDAELNRDPLYVLEDSQIEFRALQKKRMPDLTKEEFLGLFGLWEQRKIDQLRGELAKTRAALAAADRERQKLLMVRDIRAGLPEDMDLADCCAAKAVSGPEGIAALARQLLDGQ